MVALRWPVRVGAILLWALSGCTMNFPAETSEGAFACDSDEDCLNSFICEKAVCVRGTRNLIDFSGECPAVEWRANSVDLIEDPVDGIRVPTQPDTLVRFVAGNVGDDQDDPCSLFNAEWWVCAAPAGSEFADPQGCQQQASDGSNSYDFTPDLAGEYRIEFRRAPRNVVSPTEDIQSAWVVASCLPAPINLMPAATVEPGTAVTASASNLPASPNDCSVSNATWWLCNAPTGSSFASGTGDGCTQQSVGQPNVVFVPDLVGEYTVELRRPFNALDTALLQASCNSATLSKNPDAPILPGQTATITAIVTSPPSACAASQGAWYVCDAPAGSTFEEVSGCQKQASDGQVLFDLVPDLPGSYRVEYRRGDDVSITQVTASCSPATLSTDDLLDQVYSGLSIEISAAGLPSPPSACSAQSAQWWICPGSVVPCDDSQLSTTCTSLDADGLSASTYEASLHGTYQVQLCRNGRVDAIPVEVLADVLFAEVTFGDPIATRQFMNASFYLGVCADHVAESVCVADTPNHCTWSSHWDLCTDICTAYADSTACGDGFGCEWNASTLVCESSVETGLVCMRKETQAACDAVVDPDTSISGCRWNEELSLCGPDVDCAGIVDEPGCEDIGCLWNAAEQECADPIIMLQETTLTQFYADGSEVAPLKFREDDPQYRYDPNNIYAADGIRVGTGLPGAGYGVSYDSRSGTIALPHSYMFTRPPAPDGTLNCGLSSTVVFWQSGASLGNPASAVSLLETQSNLLTSSDLPTPGLHISVGFPSLLQTAQNRYRVAMGVGDPGNSDLSECVEPVSGLDQRDAMFSVMGLFAELLPKPLADRKGMELWIADIDTTNPAAPIVGKGALQAGSNIYPCAGDADCPGKASGSCTAGTCAAAVSVEGYLPRLVDHATLPGRALLFSHLTCSSGYGQDCDSGSADYDLVLARIAASGATVEGASYVANDPNIHEIDAFVTNDVFGIANILYIGVTPADVEVNVEFPVGTPGTRNIKIPVFGLYKTSTSYQAATSTWNATGSSLALYTGAYTALTAPDFESFECALGGSDGMVITSSYAITNALQFTRSPDGRYLAFAEIAQPLQCSQKNTSGKQRLYRGEPTKGDIFVIDTAGSGLPIRLYDDACVTSGPLFEINVMPTFIAAGEQLVFSSQSKIVGASSSRIMRVNLDDLDAVNPGCNVTEVIAGTAMETALTEQVNPDLIPMGTALVDSRTTTRTDCGCNTTSPDSVLLIMLATLLLVIGERRRRRPAR